MKVRVGGLAASTLLSDGSEVEEEVGWVEAVVPIAAARAAVRGDVGVRGNVGVGGGVGEEGVADVVVGRGGTAARVSSERRSEI